MISCNVTEFQNFQYKTRNPEKSGLIMENVIIRIRLNLDKHLRIKISEKSLTQRFDVSMTSFSSEKNKI